jgi:hypothetical protein
MLRHRGHDDRLLHCLSYALQAASLENFQEMASLLLICGTDVSFVEGICETPLLAAIMGGHVENRTLC